MISFDNKDLLQWSGGSWISKEPDVPVSGFSNDTRELKPGDMFLAFKTEQRDGHDHLQNALKSGASAAVVERVVDVDLPQLKVKSVLGAFQAIAKGYRNSLSKTEIVGITGSCGKTSTKDLLTQLLGSAQTYKTEKNFNNEIGVPLSLTKVDREKHRFGVIEAGISEPGEMDRLGGMIVADRVIVTSIGESHLEKLVSVLGVAKEKSMLIRNAKKGATVYMTEDSYKHFPMQEAVEIRGSFCKILSRKKRLDIETTTNVEPCYMAHAKTTQKRVRLVLKSHSFYTELEVPAMSQGLLNNLGLAVMVAIDMGIKPSDIQDRINLWKPSSYRGEWLELEDKKVLVDCYNANPVSMKDSLQYFNDAITNTPKLFIIGRMEELGEKSDQYHHEILSSMTLGSADKVCMVGEFEQSFKDPYSSSGAYIFLDSSESARSLYESWRGSVFLKGSRRAKLEILLKNE